MPHPSALSPLNPWPLLAESASSPLCTAPNSSTPSHHCPLARPALLHQPCTYARALRLRPCSLLCAQIVCTLLRPALLPAPALLCTSSCALHQIACTLLALLCPTAGNDAPARPSHHQHSTPLPPCTPRLAANPAPLHSCLLQPHPCLTCKKKKKQYGTNWHH
ncbi:hypothetical protein SLEP1_g11126 [Rubroshorea leprosula]|uniref:Uncharacterized protein n=1 Tax=Rubroshorea leprosula TaxID=152421 RepID=A0AAV5II84_9ROSI|nr:hypothetical protein SLEP1_g11126 [Rubroshorea leprosula]